MAFAGAPGSIDWSALAGQWHEDYTLREDGVRTLVPRSVDLGPARYRWSLDFEADGGFASLAIGRADKHAWTQGRWTREGDTLVTTQEVEGEDRIRRFEVVELSANRLRLRPQ